ncbi:MAG: PIG-L family deacetylase [Planctomycetia bacterium]|nr:PIG-L family deacetylase [Planctomycetia bacterium]
MRRVALCLMAHPDDCEFLAAGTLALLAERGWEIHIASSTPGDGGSATLNPIEITRIRREENVRSAAMIGAQYHCLELRDIHVTFDADSIRRAVSLVRAIAPTLMFTHAQQDYMLDHEVTAQLARAASNGCIVPNCGNGPILSGSTIPHLYYADPVGIVDHDGKLAQCSVGINITSVYAKKMDMICAHASQRDWLKAHYGVDEYTRMLDEWSNRRGKAIGVERAEGFRQHRGYGYPTNCLLKEVLGEFTKSE